MENETIKSKVLMACMYEGFLLPYSLKTITDNENFMSRTIQELTEKKLLTDRKITVKYKYTKYPINYKAITPKGVQYLIDNCSKVYPWLTYLPNPVPKFSLTQTNDVEQMYRLLKNVSATIMFQNFNIKTAIINTECKSSAKNIFFKEMVFEAMSQYKKDNGITDNYSEEGAYYRSKDISKYFHVSKEEGQQYKFSQHIGILTLRSNSYFIYHAIQQGLKINIHLMKRIKQSAGRFIEENNINSLPDIEKGIILCKNAAEFSKTFNRNYGPVSDWINNTNKRLSRAFKTLYAVPINRNGVYMLDDILYFDDKLHEKAKEKLIEFNPNFKEGIGTITELTLNSSEAYIGIDMDMVKLQYFYHEVTDNPNKRYTIICYKWQEEFYRKLFDNQVDYYITDTNLLL